MATRESESYRQRSFNQRFLKTLTTHELPLNKHTTANISLQELFDADILIFKVYTNFWIVSLLDLIGTVVLLIETLGLKFFFHAEVMVCKCITINYSFKIIYIFYFFKINIILFHR